MRLSMRLTLAMTALVLCTVAAFGGLAYYNIGHAVGPAGVQRLADQTKARIGAIDALLRTVRNELLATRSFPSHRAIADARLNGGADSREGWSEGRWRQHLGEAYAGQMSAKPGILRYRYIGFADGGRELVRTDRTGSGGEVRIVPPEELAPSLDDDLIKRAEAMAEGDVFMSWHRPAESKPGEPATVITFLTPVRTADGAPFGVIVLDLDMRPTFERIRSALSQDNKSYVVDADGYYLVNLREGRIVPTGQSRRWQDDFPALAASLEDKPGTAAVLNAPDGQRVAAVVGFTTLPGGMRIGVIETTAFDAIMAPAAALNSSSLIVALIAAMCAVLLSMLLSRSLARPVAQVTAAVQAFDKTGQLALPRGLSGETGVLAAVFEQMAGRIKATTAELRSKSDLLDQTIASMADAVLVLDAEGRRVFGNPTAKGLFGEFSDIGSERWRREYQRLRPDGSAMPELECPTFRAHSGESFDNVELAIKRTGKPAVQLSASGRPIHNADGSFGGAVIVYRDVTALREAERQLLQSLKMQAIGQLTGGVAHDLNNILTVVTGGVEILADGVADRPQLKEVATMVDQAVARASDLTNGLLSFSRKQPLQPRSLDVNALMLDTVKLLRPTLGPRIDIEVLPASELRPALADPSQLGSALINLAINARDAMNGSGRLILQTDNIDFDETYAQSQDEVEPGPYVMLAVSDTGAGIPAAIRDRVFEPFFTTKPVGEGTGLGLSMVYGFVKQSGGHLELSSEEGRGTTIRLYLPCAGTPDQSLDEAASPPLQGGRERILVVEDDALVRSYVMTHLAALGYTAFPASSAAQAMAMVYDGLEFDILFTDVIMPGSMNGPQLAAELRRHRPSLKVLFTSGFDDGAAFADQPGTDLLVKPYRRAELARMLRHVLDTRVAAPAPVH